MTRRMTLTQTRIAAIRRAGNLPFEFRFMRPKLLKNIENIPVCSKNELDVQKMNEVLFDS